MRVSTDWVRKGTTFLSIAFDNGPCKLLSKVQVLSVPVELEEALAALPARMTSKTYTNASLLLNVGAVVLVKGALTVLERNRAFALSPSLWDLTSHIQRSKDKKV